MTFETVWTFETPNFRVTLECAPESDPDLSWADEETLAKLESGEWQNLAFKVAVYDAHGCEIGSDYLGNSIHADAADFRDHRACGRENRRLAAAGERGRCGSYFSDMVHNACDEARRVYSEPRAKLRPIAAVEAEPYGRHLPIFHTPHEPMSEDAAERWAERYTDRADAALMGGRATQAQYDAWTKALDAWVTRHSAPK